jgi:hypothetical protein
VRLGTLLSEPTTVVTKPATAGGREHRVVLQIVRAAIWVIRVVDRHAVEAKVDA